MKIAIVGLGRVGSEFLDQMLEYGKDGVEIAAVAELADTPGKKRAEEAGIQIKSQDEVVKMGENLDIVFDLTGDESTRKSLREQMAASNNQHTIIAPETIAYLIWSIATKKPLPDVHSHKGY